jgi:Flp pilus assembly protein TadD
MQLGKFVEAKADFEQALKLKPDDKYAAEWLKRLLKRKPKKK